MAQYDVDLREYWRIIKKRKLIIIAVTVGVALLSYAFSKMKEPAPLYRAESAIKIEQKTDMGFIRSTGLWIQAESMDTHAYTLKSFPVLKIVAGKLGWIDNNLSDEAVQTNHSKLRFIDRLKSMVSTEVNEHTSIINIKVVSLEDAKNGDQEVVDVANEIANAYKEFNVQEKNKRTQEIKTFIENQLTVLSERVINAEKALRQFQEENEMLSVNEKTRQIKKRLSSAIKEKEDVLDQKNTIMHQIFQLKNKNEEGLAETIAKQLTYAEKGSPLHGTGKRLDKLLQQRQSLLSRYTDKHPNVQDVNNRIGKIVGDAKGDLETYLSALNTRENELNSQINRLEEEARRLPEKEHLLARLQKEASLQEQLYTELQKKHQEVLIQESGKMDFVTIVKPAIRPLQAFNKASKPMIILTGIILGFILGLVFAFGVEMFDTSMGTIEDVETSLQVPVLGVIPHLGGEDIGKKTISKKVSEVERTRDLITHYDPKSLASEAFRSLRTNLQFVLAEKKSKTFLLTSAFVKEGKTINAVNLALSLAQTGKKVLIVEADLRRSTIYKIFDLPRSPGLTDYVLGDYEWRETINTITDVMLGDFEIDDILKTPGLDNLHMITSGTKPPNPTEILNSNRFRELLKEASEEYSYILVDAPPVLPVADPCEIAPHTDGVILVYTVGRIARGILRRAKSTLDNVDANVIGVILNNVKPEVGPDYFKYHTYYYYGPDKKRT